MATLPDTGWSNVIGTSTKSCPCGSWKDHWRKHSGVPWPSTCIVVGCSQQATVGGHVKNAVVSGNRIAPICDGCNKRQDSFSLAGTLTNDDINT